MEGLREFLETRTGRVMSVGFIVVAVGVLVASVWASLGGNEAAAASRERLFICAETGRPFVHEIQAGESMPVRSPHTGKDTGYPAERCYWTADGSIKDEPTPVLLNEWGGKPGATFCPDCNRLVVGHNPQPAPGDTPPPTRDRYKPSKRELRNDQ